MSNELLVYGASGHAKVVIDVAEKRGLKIIGIVDDAPGRSGKPFCGYPVLGDRSVLEQHRRVKIVVAIGDNCTREGLQQQVKNMGYELVTVVHPTAALGADVIIGRGTVVMAQTAINSGTRIGEGAIVNTGATIDHDCEIGDFAHISPGAHLAGQVAVGPLAHIGIGASVIQGVKIGEGAVIGAGAAVVENVPDYVVCAGVPARVIKAVARENR